MKHIRLSRLGLIVGLLLSVAGAALASTWTENYFRWRGEVDGADVLIIRGQSVRIEHRSAGPIRDARFEFSTPLPVRDLQVRLDVRKGRGSVEILQRPDRINNYTARILLDDTRHSGRGDYEFYLYWEVEGGGSSSGGGWDGSSDGGEYDFVWEGEVDGADYLFIRDRSVWVRHIDAKPIRDARYDFRTNLPKLDQAVQLDQRGGRGRVRIEEQPHRGNNYTLKILLDDTGKSGADWYRIGLRWSGSGSGGGWGQPAAGGTIRWSGNVDGRDRLYFRGRKVDVQHMDARPIRNMQAEFSAPLPNRDVTVRLNVIRGRGEVRILEQPSRRNNYTLEVEIYDPKGGDSDYQLEFSW